MSIDFEKLLQKRNLFLFQPRKISYIALQIVSYKQCYCEVHCFVSRPSTLITVIVDTCVLHSSLSLLSPFSQYLRSISQ